MSWCPFVIGQRVRTSDRLPPGPHYIRGEGVVTRIVDDEKKVWVMFPNAETFYS